MLEEKREKFLKLLEVKEKLFKEYEQKYAGAELLKIIKKLLIYRKKYLWHLFSKIVSFPLKSETFFGRTFWLFSESFSLYSFGILGSSQEIKLTKFLIKNLPESSVFYDIGANLGFYSALVEDLLEKKEIHAFEPAPIIFQYLKKNLHNLSNIFLNQFALFNEENEIDFYDGTKTGFGESSTFNVSAMSNFFSVSKFKKIKVKTTTLDKYCFSHSLPNFLKIDVEGSEGEVIEGGIETLKKINPIISLEIWRKPLDNSSHLKAIEILSRFGYKSYKIDEDGELIFVEKLIPEKEIPEGKLFDNFIFKK